MTIAVLDYRRTDQRSQVLENPYWITSGLVSCVAADDKAALLFSFPVAKRVVFVLDVVVQNFEVLDTGVTAVISSGTLASDTVTTGGVLTEVTAGNYIIAADSILTANTCWGATTANTSTWLTAKAANTYAAARVITGAASTVPCVFAAVSKSGVIATGTFRVHMLISVVPGT